MPSPRVAIVTGASIGLGRALAGRLVADGWTVVVDGRRAELLARAASELGPQAIAVPGDVTDPDHRRELVRVAESLGRLELVVNNASTLGTTPMPALSEHPLDDLADVLDTNVVSPIGLAQLALPALRRHRGAVLNLSSDAAVEAYPTWGAYGASKAALAHASRVMDAEEPDVRVVAVDPGDMRTEMHQAAFPGEDISDRPLPSDRVDDVLAACHAAEV